MGLAEHCYGLSVAREKTARFEMRMRPEKKAAVEALLMDGQSMAVWVETAVDIRLALEHGLISVVRSGGTGAVDPLAAAGAVAAAPLPVVQANPLRALLAPVEEAAPPLRPRRVKAQPEPEPEPESEPFSEPEGARVKRRAPRQRGGRQAREEAQRLGPPEVAA